MKRSTFLLALIIAMSTLVSCKCSCKHQYQEWVVSTEATCEETGVMTRTCKKCNKVEEQTIVALGHDYGNLISGITPTCEQTGEIAHYQCSRCNKYFDEQKNEVSSLVLPTQHKLTKIFQKDATCYEAGFIAHEHCEVCGKNFVDGEEKTDDEIKIVSTGHSFIENQKIEADCHTNGTKAHLHCDKCNKNFIKGVEVGQDELVILASHDIIDIKEISNTCTENGVAAHTYCYVCGKNFINEVEKSKDELVILAAHRLHTINQVDKKCDENGTKAHDECYICNKKFINNQEVTKSELMIPAGHTYSDLIQEENKRDHYKCQVCNKYFDTEYRLITVLDLPTHNFGSWIEEVPATCTSYGQRGHYKCSDAECEGLSFDIDYNIVSDITISPSHNYQMYFDEQFHYEKCSECSDIKNQDYHSIINRQVLIDGKYYVSTECDICDYEEEKHLDDNSVVDIWVKRSFILGIDSTRFYQAYAITQGGHEFNSTIGLFMDTSVIEEYVTYLETLDKSSFPVKHEFKVSYGLFSKMIEITFDIERREAYPQFPVYQKGYLNSLNDMYIYIESNYNSTGRISLSDCTIIDDGGFDANYDFANGNKKYTIKFTYNDEAYEVSFVYVNKRVINRVYESLTEIIVPRGEYPSISIGYSDADYTTTVPMLMFDIVKGSYDKDKLGQQIFTIASPEGYVELELVVRVVEKDEIAHIQEENLIIPINSNSIDVVVTYVDRTKGIEKITEEMIIDFDYYNSGSKFDFSKTGQYDIVFVVKGITKKMSVTIYDPDNLQALYMYLASSNTVVWEYTIDQNTSKPILDIDLTGMVLRASFDDGITRSINITEDMLEYTETELLDAIQSQQSIDVTVKYQNLTTSFSVTFASKEVSGVLNVCDNEGSCIGRILVKDGVLQEEYTLLIEQLISEESRYYYIPLTPDMICSKETGEPFDYTKLSKGRYETLIKLDGVTYDLDVHTYVYQESDIEKDFTTYNLSIRYMPCGNKKAIYKQLELITFKYYERVEFGNITTNLVEEELKFKDVELISKDFDYSKPGYITLKFVYKSLNTEVNIELSPNFDLYLSRDYVLITNYGTIDLVTLYENGYYKNQHHFSKYEIIDNLNRVYKLYEYEGLFVLEGNKLLEWTGEKYGLKYNITPVEYKINKDVVKVYTYNGISYADIYRMDGTTLRYNGTVVAQYIDENTLSLGDVKYTIGADNQLSVIYEGEQVYIYEEVDQSYKVVVKFNDSGKAYLITIITSPATSEVTERIEIFDWIEEDGIISLMTKDYILTQFIVNEDGTLSLDIK